MIIARQRVPHSQQLPKLFAFFFFPSHSLGALDAFRHKLATPPYMLTGREDNEVSILLLPAVIDSLGCSVVVVAYSLIVRGKVAVPNVSVHTN